MLSRLLYALYIRRLEKQLDGEVLPKHVAVVCDGNRRWAREAGFTDVSHGHRMGAQKIVDMLHWCDNLGIDHATVYLLSVENLQRDPEELSILLEIIRDVVADICSPAQNWNVSAVGSLDLLPENISREIEAHFMSTQTRTGLNVNIAIGYGGRQEIADAAKSLLSYYLDQGVSPAEILEHITVEKLAQHLYTSGQPDPDLVIRTSGEQRLSGFLLWQSAYAEIWFTEAYWPEFRRLDFLRALRDYSHRSRRFGV